RSNKVFTRFVTTSRDFSGIAPSSFPLLLLVVSWSGSFIFGSKMCDAPPPKMQVFSVAEDNCLCKSASVAPGFTHCGDGPKAEKILANTTKHKRPVIVYFL